MHIWPLPYFVDTRDGHHTSLVPVASYCKLWTPRAGYHTLLVTRAGQNTHLTTKSATIHFWHKGRPPYIFGPKGRLLCILGPKGRLPYTSGHKGQWKCTSDHCYTFLFPARRSGGGGYWRRLGCPSVRPASGCPHFVSGEELGNPCRDFFNFRHTQCKFAFWVFWNFTCLIGRPSAITNFNMPDIWQTVPYS